MAWATKHLYRIVLNRQGVTRLTGVGDTQIGLKI